MRVRYGKPIKVSNCYPYTNSTTIFPRSGTTSNSYMTVVHYDDAKVFSAVQDNLNHLYFFYAEINGNTSSLRNDILLGSNSLSQQSRYVNGNKFCAVAKLTSVGLTSVFFYRNNNEQIGDFTVLFHCGIDLTKAFGSGKEPTAQEFYNKYNKYFPLIATGEEITIDDKAGQVSLKKLLPDEYQEVEYIEGDGGQYMPVINTLNNRAINGNLTVGYKFQATVHDRAMYFSTIECNLSASQAYSLGYISANSYLYIRWNQMVNSNTQVVGYQVGDIVEVIRTNNVETILKTYSLFTHGDSSTLTWKGRIYKYWLKLDNEYLFNWIPCYRKSDNVIGLYDLVSGTFSTNIGTGTFLKGPNVTNTISCKVAGGSSDIYYGYNQILNRSTFTSNGITWTLNADSTFTLSGTTTSTYSSFGLNGILKKNHKYLNIFQILENPNNISIGSGFFNMGQKNPKISSGFSGAISLYPYDSSYDSIGIDQYGGVGVDLTGIKIRFQIIDLTWWYGENKEPSTYNEFKEKFTKEYYGACLTPVKLTRYQIEALPNYEYNQLVEISNSKVTGSGVTKTINGTEVTFTASTVGGTRGQFSKISIVSNHKYLVSAYLTQSKNGNARFCLFNSNFTSFVDSGKIALTANTQYLYQGILTATFDDTNGNLSIYQRYGEASSAVLIGDNIKVDKTMLIDLTDWYGEGKEPTTVEEFKQTFPNKYYAYSKKRLLNKYMINKLEN